MSIGLYIVRYRRKKLGVPRSEFRAWDAAVVFTILQNLYLLIMPWYHIPVQASLTVVAVLIAGSCIASVFIQKKEEGK